MDAIERRRADMIGRLRGALAALGTDPSGVEEQVRNLVEGRRSEAEMAGVEHAMLAGLLYRVAAIALRESLTCAPKDFSARWIAVSPQSVTVAGEDAAAQTVFEAFWVQERIDRLIDDDLALSGGRLGDRIPTVLGAAVQAAEAAKVLLEIRFAQGEGREETEGLFATVSDRLERASRFTGQAYFGDDIVEV